MLTHRTVRALCSIAVSITLSIALFACETEEVSSDRSLSAEDTARIEAEGGQALEDYGAAVLAVLGEGASSSLPGRGSGPEKS